MPYRMNGIGTWYYGRKNVHQHKGVCGTCGKITTISSYDTRKFITLFYLPIFPLGKLRVINQCPACSYHYPVPYKKYYKEKQEAYEEVLSNYERNPNSPEAVKRLIGLYSDYQDTESFFDIVNSVVDGNIDDAGVLTAVGYAYYRFGYTDEAVEVFLRSLEIVDDMGVNETLGFIYLQRGEPDNAEVHFQHIIRKRLREKASILLGLVEAFQYEGRHEDALRILEQACIVDISIENNKVYKNLKKVSEKRRHTNKPVKNTCHFEFKKRMYISNNAKVAWGIGAVVIAGLLGLYLFMAYQKGSSRVIYMVNGLSRPYNVLVNSEPYTLRPNRALRVNVAEWAVVVEVEDKYLDVGIETYNVKTCFLIRPFLNKTFVINPDTVAPIFWSKIHYSENPETGPEDEGEFYVGKSFYVFDGIDYVFVPFPSEISIPSGSTVAKERICLAEDNGISKDYLPMFVSHNYGDEATVEYLHNHIKYDPNDETFLFALYSRLGRKDFIELIRSELDKRPVNINHHRLYQGAVEETFPEYNLVDEYKSYLDKEPESSALKYLLARVVRNTDESERLLQESVSGLESCPYGYYALSFHESSRGKFDEALELLEKAMELDSGNIVFKQFYYEVLKATQQYDKAIEYCVKKQKENIFDSGWVFEEIKLWYLSGKPARAREVYDKFLGEVRNLYNEENIKALENAMDLTCAYCLGDIQEYAEKLPSPADPNNQLFVALNMKNPIDEKLLQQISPQGPHLYLLGYIHEHSLGDLEKAEKYLSTAVERLYLKGWPESMFAESLSDEDKLVPEELCNVSMEMNNKAILLTALGVKYPKYREDFFGLAEKLNYNRAFPYHFLRSVHKQANVIE